MQGGKTRGCVHLISYVIFAATVFVGNCMVVEDVESLVLLREQHFYEQFLPQPLTVSKREGKSQRGLCLLSEKGDFLGRASKYRETKIEEGVLGLRHHFRNPLFTNVTICILYFLC